jgi:hypothetical protein
MPELSDVMALQKGRRGVGLYASTMEEQRWLGGSLGCGKYNACFGPENG